MNDLISKSALLKRIGDEVRNQAEFYADRNNLVVLAYGDCYGKVQTAPTIDERSIVDGYCKKEHLVLVRAELWDDLVRAYQQSRGTYSYVERSEE